jgi:integrase
VYQHSPELRALTVVFSVGLADGFVREQLWQEARRTMAVIAQTICLPGDLRIAEILPSHIFELLKPIWIEKRETSNRIRGRIETIIAKNVDINDTEFRNPAELTKQLREKLPKRPKHKARHHPALPYAETPQFMPELAGADGGAAQALCFLIFTVCRTNEVLGAR